MKRNTLLLTALAAILASSGAVAQMEGDAYYQGKPVTKTPQEIQAERQSQRQVFRINEQQRRNEIRQQRELRAQQNRWRDERGAGPEHRWRRGEILPPQYRNNSYVVDNWRAHNLRQPPRGYEWVQSGGDYVLVGIATGLIVDLLLNQ